MEFVTNAKVYRQQSPPKKTISEKNERKHREKFNKKRKRVQANKQDCGRERF